MRYTVAPPGVVRVDFRRTWPRVQVSPALLRLLIAYEPFAIEVGSCSYAGMSLYTHFFLRLHCKTVTLAGSKKRKRTFRDQTHTNASEAFELEKNENIKLSSYVENISYCIDTLIVVLRSGM